MVSAFTATSPPADPRLGSLPREAREKAARGRIGFALEQLARLREGAFGFELTDEVPTAVGGRDIRLETLARGINPQEMLLDLAQGMDDDRAQSAAAVEASFAAPEEALVVAGEPIVPSEALVSDLREEGEEAPAVAAPPAEAEWAATPVPRYGTDTQPLPRIVLPGPGAEPAAAPPRGAARRRTGPRPRRGAGRGPDGRAEDPARGRRGGRARHPRPSLRRRRVRDRRGGGPRGGGQGRGEAPGGGRPVRPRHRPRHAGLGRSLVPRGLRGGEAPVEDEPPTARADDDGEPQPVAAAARAADGRPVLRLQADPQQAQRAPVRGRPLGLRGQAGERRAAAAGRGGRGSPRIALEEEGRRPGGARRGAPLRGRRPALRVPQEAARGPAAGRGRQPDRGPPHEGRPGVLRAVDPVPGQERRGPRASAASGSPRARRPSTSWPARSRSPSARPRSSTTWPGAAGPSAARRPRTGGSGT